MTSTGGPAFTLGVTGPSQNLGGGGGGGGGGSLIGTNRLGALLFLTRDCFICPTKSKLPEGELRAFAEPLSDKEDDEDSDRVTDTGIGAGRDGATKLITEWGEFDFKLVGLKFNCGETELDKELAGEADFEHGYEAVLELKLLLPKFSPSTALKTLSELTPLTFLGLAEDPLGEKNSSSPSSSEPSSCLKLRLKLCLGSGGSGVSSGEPSF